MSAFSKLINLAGLFTRRPRDVIWFWRSYQTWQRTASEVWQAKLGDLRPCLADRYDSAATAARGHYFLQDLWAAQRVHRFNPELHVDVASRVDGFVAHVASFCPVEYLDIRPLAAKVPGLTCRQGTICELPQADRSIRSLSCLHVLEHVGLGRYGDPVDPDAWKRGLSELQRVLAAGGQLLLGTPCGRPKVEFHAHRVFAPEHIVAALPELQLMEFSLIDDGLATEWRENVPLSAAQNLDFGCGLFLFQRPK